jgi:DNA processing protein
LLQGGAPPAPPGLVSMPQNLCYDTNVVSPRAAQPGRGRPGGQGPERRGRYLPPAQWVQVASTAAGITNGLSLKVPYLYLAGDQQLLDRPAVAIVGSRKASEDGRRRAAKLAKALVAKGIVVMSGLAEGIDEAAHVAAIDAGGSTVAVIGTPLDKAYPAKHGALQQAIYERHLLVSPFPAGTRTFPSHFPERNRVMARLSRATVIVEAGDTSGALHQAVECESVGRALFIAASVMNDPKLTWPKRFKTAIVLEAAEQVLAQISG